MQTVTVRTVVSCVLAGLSIARIMIGATRDEVVVRRRVISAGTTVWEPVAAICRTAGCAKPAPANAMAINNGASRVAVENETSPRDTTARKMTPTNVSEMAMPIKAFAGDGTVWEKSRVASRKRTIIATPRVMLRIVVKVAEFPVTPSEG